MNINIASNLKRLRRERDLTQDELAGFLGISFQAISKWERGDGYPDITFLPVLANFFNVTIDELVGMDEIRSAERIGKIHAQWKENNANGKNAENILLMRETLKVYPNDYLCMVQLVTSLEKCKSAPEETARNRAEAIELSERIIEHCPDTEIRNAVLFNICHSYWKSGDTEKAVKRARQLPTIYKTQENALVLFLKGEKRISVGQQAVIAIIFSLFQQVLAMADTEHYSFEEKIVLLKKCCETADSLLENNDVPAVLRCKVSALMKAADIALEHGSQDAAIGLLQSAADNALKSIRIPQSSKPESLLANGIEVESVTTGDFQRLRMSTMLLDQKYDSLRADIRFKKICKMVETVGE
jgi:transcriptional regulator with XRE-family HTH domain